jgi:hypothetical protein
MLINFHINVISNYQPIQKKAKTNQNVQNSSKIVPTSFYNHEPVPGGQLCGSEFYSEINFHSLITKSKNKFERYTRTKFYLFALDSQNRKRVIFAKCFSTGPTGTSRTRNFFNILGRKITLHGPHLHPSSPTRL